jgi:hypothetical protein
LIRDGDTQLAVLVARTERGFNEEIKVQVLAPQREAAEACLAALRMAMRKRNVHRGHVVSFSLNRSQALEVRFHHLPRISREQIIALRRSALASLSWQGGGCGF